MNTYLKFSNKGLKLGCWQVRGFTSIFIVFMGYMHGYVPVNISMCVVCVIKICNKSDGGEKETECDRDKEEKRFNLFHYPLLRQ